MKVTASGIVEMQKALVQYPEAFFSIGRKTLIKYGNKMARDAKRDHRYNRQSGNLDKSIEAVVPRDKLGLKFWINPTLVTSGKYNYGLIQHEGSGKGYKRSRGAKRYSTKLKSKGILNDHFLVRAWDKNIDSLKDALVKNFIKAAKKVRLK